jgi:sulfide:quinone oxidoreductase
MTLSTLDAGGPLRIVIAGGGVAALEAMIALRARTEQDFAVTLVSASDTFSYRALSVGEPFGLGHPTRYQLDRLCEDHGARFVHARVAAVQAGEHRVALDDGSRMHYDALIVAVGARRAPPFDYGVTFDREVSPTDFDDVLADLRDGFAPRIAIVVPDTVTWTLPAYELALMTAAWGKAEHPGETSVVVVTHEPRPLDAFGTAVSNGVDALLAHAGIERRCGVHPDLLSFTALRAGGRWVPADRIVCLPHVFGPRLAGVPCDQHGFIPVDAFGRVPGLEDVYAAGDGTALPFKQGGLAAQLAEVVCRSITARVEGAEDPPPFAPVLRGLLPTEHGPRYLRAELADPEGTSTISREPLWWPPSKIASRWLAPHLARVEAARGRGEIIGRGPIIRVGP